MEKHGFRKVFPHFVRWTTPGRCGRLPLGATEECAGLDRAAARTGTIHPAAVALQFLGLQLQAALCMGDQAAGDFTHQ